jgi:hypothetical protein
VVNKAEISLSLSSMEMTLLQSFDHVLLQEESSLTVNESSRNSLDAHSSSSSSSIYCSQPHKKSTM